MKLVCGMTACAALWLLHAWLGPLPESWVYDRAAVRSGELWRLLSAHLVHVDGAHAMWNGLGLALVVAIVGELGMRRVLLFAAAAIAAINASLLLLAVSIDGYCGASGVSSGVLAAGLTALWLRSREPIYLLALGLWSAKILTELTIGGSLVLDTVWPSWPGAHLAGACAGVIVAGMTQRRRSSTGTVLVCDERSTGWPRTVPVLSRGLHHAARAIAPHTKRTLS